MADLQALVDRVTVAYHRAQRRVIGEFSGTLSRDYRALRAEVDAMRAEAGLGPSPVEMAWDGEESIDLEEGD